MEGTLPKVYPHMTVIMPVHNKEPEIENAIRCVLSSMYPKDKLRLIVVNDCSTDRSLEVIKQLKKKLKFDLIDNPKNIGKSRSINNAMKQVTSEFMAVVDGDSFIDKKALAYMATMIREKDVGAVTASITALHAKTFLQRLQDIEYSIIIWVRKLLQAVESIYVTPGPLAVYRTKLIRKIGGFDPHNITEDIEIAWRIMYHGYKIRLSLQSKVKVITPTKFYPWWRQRLRWSMGGMQTLLKYKHTLFRSRYGMLGKFVSPFVVLSIFTSLSGFVVFVYSMYLLLLRYSYYFISSPMFVQNFKDAFLLPSVFTYFGLIIFIMSITYIYLGLDTMDNKRHFNFRKMGFIDLIVYLTLYITIFPIILLVAMYRIITGDMSWY